MPRRAAAIYEAREAESSLSPATFELGLRSARQGLRLAVFGLEIAEQDAVDRREHPLKARLNAGKPEPGKGSAAAIAMEEFRSEEHTSELQSLMRISYAVFCLQKKKKQKHNNIRTADKNK